MHNGFKSEQCTCSNSGITLCYLCVDGRLCCMVAAPYMTGKMGPMFMQYPALYGFSLQINPQVGVHVACYPHKGQQLLCTHGIVDSALAWQTVLSSAVRPATGVVISCRDSPVQQTFFAHCRQRLAAAAPAPNTPYRLAVLTSLRLPLKSKPA